MIKNILNVEDKLFSTLYGEVSIFRLVENTGHIIKSTKEAKNKKEMNEFYRIQKELKNKFYIIKQDAKNKEDLEFMKNLK